MSVVSNQFELLPPNEGAVEAMIYVDEEDRDDPKLSSEKMTAKLSQ